MFNVVSGEIRNDESCLRRLQWVWALFQGNSALKQHWFIADFSCSGFLVFQRCVRENKLCFRENQRWNSSDSALIFLLWKFGVSALFQRKSALFQRKSPLKQLWFSADFFALKISSFRAVSENISAVQLWISSVSKLNSAVSALIFSSENFRFQRCSELNQRCSEIFR